jgi:hypothetical protein
VVLRDRASWVVACFVHVGLLAAVASRAPRVPVIAPSEPAPAASAIDLDLEPLPEAPWAVERLVVARVEARNDAPRPSLQSIALATAPSPSVAATQAGSETEPAGSSSAAPSWTFAPGPPRLFLGVAGVVDLHAPEPVPDGHPGPKPVSTTGGLEEGLADHDTGLGLGRAGPILAATEEATRTSPSAPVSGTATFDVTVRADGTVLAHVVSSDGGDATDWSRVADDIARTLDPKRVRLPTDGRGWHAVVRVEAKVLLADGRDVRSVHGVRGSVEPSILQQQLKEGAHGRGGAGSPDRVAPEESEKTVPPPVGGALGPAKGGSPGAIVQGIAQRILPTPTVSVSGKVCQAQIGITATGISASGWCSPENVGTPATRVVSGRVVREGAL